MNFNNEPLRWLALRVRRRRLSRVLPTLTLIPTLQCPNARHPTYILYFCKVYTLYNNTLIEFYVSNVTQRRLNTKLSRYMRKL